MQSPSNRPSLEAIVVVLDRPRDVANVGGVVRAMSNFGLSRLRLVEPAAYDEERVLAAAHRGARVIANMTRHANLDEALADCGFVLGTTARPRAIRHERIAPREAATALLSVSRNVAVPSAIVFGPEDRGLTNAALGRCNAVVTIPAIPDCMSLNLAQAVLIVCYEIWIAARTPRSHAIPDVVRAAATAHDVESDELPGAEREAMFAALADVLWGMHPNNDRGRVEHTLARFRAVLLRAAPRVEETRMLTRFFVHIAAERRANR